LAYALGRVWTFYDGYGNSSAGFLRKNTCGFMGVGNTTAGEKLDVTGNIRASGMVTGNVVRAANGFQGRGIVNQIMPVSPNNNIS